jgi:hypothetical protein
MRVVVSVSVIALKPAGLGTNTPDRYLVKDIQDDVAGERLKA